MRCTGDGNVNVSVWADPVSHRHAVAGLWSSTFCGLKLIGLPFASVEFGAWHEALTEAGATAPAGGANVVVGAGALVAGGFVAGAFVAGGFVAGAFVAGGFVAGAFVAGGFVAGAFVAGGLVAGVPPAGIASWSPGRISELAVNPLADSSASSVTPTLRAIPDSVSPATTV